MMVCKPISVYSFYLDPAERYLCCRLADPPPTTGPTLVILGASKTLLRYMEGPTMGWRVAVQFPLAVQPCLLWIGRTYLLYSLVYCGQVRHTSDIVMSTMERHVTPNQLGVVCPSSLEVSYELTNSFYNLCTFS